MVKSQKNEKYVAILHQSTSQEKEGAHEIAFGIKSSYTKIVLSVKTQENDENEIWVPASNMAGSKARSCCAPQHLAPLMTHTLTRANTTEHNSPSFVLQKAFLFNYILDHAIFRYLLRFFTIFHFYFLAFNP